MTNPLHLIQITDIHLGEQPGDNLLGMDTDESLQLVLDLIRTQRKEIDVLLATGDIANHGSEAAYQRFFQSTQSITAQQYWLPGNHDDRSLMEQVAPQQMVRSLRLSNWLILMLNSAVDGEVGGQFAEAELLFLREQLTKTSAEHCLVCLHHHPIACGSDWLDQQQVSNAEAFFKVLDQFEIVRGVLWGHIHQQIDVSRKGVKMMATPSTCVQFAVNSSGFKLDRRNPGYRWLNLHQDGRIETGVERIEAAFNIDYDKADGY